MSYTKQTWHDWPMADTPITAARLEHIEDGIDTAGVGLQTTVTWPGTGVDAYDAFQAAITAVEAAGGGIVRLEAGKNYTLSKSGGNSLMLARNNDGSRGRVTIDLNGSMVTLTSNVPRFLSFTKVADLDTFQKIRVVNGIIDAGDVTGSHSVIGTYAAGNLLTRVSFNDIVFRDVQIVNLHTDTTLANRRFGFHFQVRHEAAGETQTVITGIKWIDCSVGGGLSGFTAVGYVPTGTSTVGTNIWIDDIHSVRCRHVIPSAADSLFSSSNIQIGSFGYGGKCRIVDFYGSGAGDVGVEVNSLLDIQVVRTTIENSWAYAFFHTNFNYPSIQGTAPAATEAASQLSSQRVVFDRCVARRTAGTIGSGFQLRKLGGANLGNVTYHKCEWHRSTAEIGVIGEALGVDLGSSASTMVSLDVEIQTVQDGISVGSGAGTSTTGPVRLTGTSIGTARLNVDMTYKGTSASASAQTVRYIDLGPSLAVTGSIHINADFSSDLTGGWTGGHYGILPGFAGTTTLRGLRIAVRIRKWLNMTSASNVILFGGTAALTLSSPVDIDDCDFSAMSNASELVFSSTSNANNVRIGSRVVWRSGSTALDVASANATIIVPAADGVQITGSTGPITGIAAGPRGAVIRMWFASTPTLNNATTVKLAGAANFVASADDVLTLMSDGTNWREVARSVN